MSVKGKDIEFSKSPKKFKLMYGCEDESHDKIILFETHTEAHLHTIDTGHKTKLMRLDLD